MFAWVGSGFAWLKNVYDETSAASFARVATTPTVLTGCWAVVHLVRRNGALPDGGTLLALGAWMISPYAVNKTANVLNGALGRSPDPGHVDDVHASSDAGRD